MWKHVVMIALLLFPVLSNADENMGRYILDGRAALYAPSINETARVVQFLFKKYKGSESVKAMSVWQKALRSRLGINIFNPEEARASGFDTEGSVAYVHMDTNEGYMLFTIKNKELLTYTLDNLPNPVPYRILDEKYVLFSATEKFFDYQNFNGLSSVPAFKIVAKGLNFNWTQNFVWINGSYLKEKSMINSGQFVFPDGDNVGVVVSFNEDRVSLDAYTVYKDKLVQDALKKSIRPLKEQTLSLLDFQNGDPVVVGNAYFDLSAYIQSILNIDKAEELGLRKIFSDLEKKDINLKERLFPYLRGRISYVINSFDLSKKNIDFTLVAGVSDEIRVKEFLAMLTASMRGSGKKVPGKDLFTRQFFGIPVKGAIVWMGIVEKHLIISSSESNLNIFVQNIYEKKDGYLQKLPPAFARAVKSRIYGAQHHISVPKFLQKIQLRVLPGISKLLIPFETVEWYYYLQEVDGLPVRRDTVMGTFFER